MTSDEAPLLHREIISVRTDGIEAVSVEENVKIGSITRNAVVGIAIISILDLGFLLVRIGSTICEDDITKAVAAVFGFVVITKNQIISISDQLWCIYEFLRKVGNQVKSFQRITSSKSGPITRPAHVS